MKRQLFHLTWILVVFLWTNITPLTIAKASLEELVAESALIVHGTVNAIEYQWEDENQRAINTLLTIDVNAYLKGNGESQVVVTQMGGKIGDLTDEVHGAPAFQPGEEVVLFLLEHQGRYHIHSIALGSFRVFADEENGKRVENDLRNIHLIDPETGKEVSPEDAVTAFRFDAFVSKIKSHLNQD